MNFSRKIRHLRARCHPAVFFSEAVGARPAFRAVPYSRLYKRDFCIHEYGNVHLRGCLSHLQPLASICVCLPHLHAMGIYSREQPRNAAFRCFENATSRKYPGITLHISNSPQRQRRLPVVYSSESRRERREVHMQNTFIERHSDNVHTLVHYGLIPAGLSDIYPRYVSPMC